MKKIFTVLVLIFISLSYLKAQEDYFNHRYYFDENYSAVQMSSIVATDSAYYATLVAFDTSLLDRVGSVFVKFDLEGNVLEATPHIDSTIALQTWRPTLKINQDGHFITCGKYLIYDDDWINRAILIKINEAGEYIQTKEYYSPFVETNDFIVPMALELCEDGGYVVVNNISSPDVNKTNIWITRFDVNFNIIWDKIILDPWQITSRSIKEDAQGNFIIGAWTHDYTPQHRYDITSQTYLLKLDADGNLLWEYHTPEEITWGPAFDIIPTEDNGIVVAGLEGEEWTYPIGAEGDSISFLVFEHTMFKLDSNLEMEWKVHFPDRDTLHIVEDGYYVKMVEAGDGSGYVAGGATLLIDTFINVQERAGWLTKVSESGDSLWSRHLYYLDSTLFNAEIMDLAESYDGGYIISGKCFKKGPWDGEPGAQQQGWLLKVDEYGCLVPDCQGDTVDAVDIPEALPFRLLLYPNPVQQELYVHFQTKDFKRDNHFRIIAFDGRVMQDFSSPSAEGTFIANVENYPSGMYVLEYFEAGVLLGSEQFLKE